MTTVDEDVVSKGRGGMDLAWVLLIWIRSLFLFSCSPVLWFFLIVFCSPYSTCFFVLLFFCIVLLSFFFVFHSLFFLRGDEDVAIWRGVHVIG